MGVPNQLTVLTEQADLSAKIFPWSMPGSFYLKPNTTVIYGTCLIAGKTRKGDVFSKSEIERHGSTLISGPIEVGDHSWDVGKSCWLPYPDNVILDAEEADGRLEYIARLADAKTQEAVKKAQLSPVPPDALTGVSVNAICRHVPSEDPGKCEGMILNGFLLLRPDQVPASPGTCVKVWNCCKTPCYSQGSGSNVDPNNAKTAQMPGHGPVAGQPEPSLEDRVKTLEQAFASFQQYTGEDIRTIRAQLQTVIDMMPAVATASTKLTPAPASKTEIEWDTAYINDLPDDCFAFIDEGGKKDDQGKTAPRDLRHLPFKNAQGAIDHDHLVNALARVKQSETMPEGGKTAATKKLCAAVKDWNADHENKIESEVCNVKPQNVGPAASAPVAAVVPPASLPSPEPVVKVEEINAIVSDKRLFTPALKLRGILDLCEQRRTEAA